jgi:hypothetical protein
MAVENMTFSLTDILASFPFAGDSVRRVIEAENRSYSPGAVPLAWHVNVRWLSHG